MTCRGSTAMLADGAATVAELAALLAPWPYTDPRETWAQHSVRLHRDEPAKMAALAEAMRSAGRWLGPPLAWVGPFVQDGHHRLVTAMCLGWHGRTVPAEPVTALPDLTDYIAELHGLLASARPAPVAEAAVRPTLVTSIRRLADLARERDGLGPHALVRVYLPLDLLSAATQAELRHQVGGCIELRDGVGPAVARPAQRRVVLPAGTVVWPLAGLERRAPLVRQAADALGVRRAR
jgi:hypothetical protein